MKKQMIYVIVAIILIVIVSLLVIFINRKNEPNNNPDNNINDENVIPETTGNISKIYILHHTWSGWNGGSVSKKELVEFEIKENETYKIDNSYALEFNIVSKSDNSITIKTTRPFSSQSEGVNLNSNETTFTISRDTNVELTSLTMDAGWIYEIYVR